MKWSRILPVAVLTMGIVGVVTVVGEASRGGEPVARDGVHGQPPR